MGNYLRVPLLHNQVSRRTYDYLLDKMKHKIASWNASRLSLAGRLVLAQTSLIPIPQYSMQTATIPEEVNNQVPSSIINLKVSSLYDPGEGWKWSLFENLLPASSLFELML
ncbi:hypothetical protein ACFE04_011373 [Oxalis oulophora]